MHDNIVIGHNYISKKEEEEFLSLFRIPINFFSDNNLNNFHDKLKKLKEEINVSQEKLDINVANIPVSPTNNEKNAEESSDDIDEDDDMNEFDDDDDDVMDELDDDDDDDDTIGRFDDNNDDDVMDELDDDDNDDVMDELEDDNDKDDVNSKEEKSNDNSKDSDDKNENDDKDNNSNDNADSDTQNGNSDDKNDSDNLNNNLEGDKSLDNKTDTSAQNDTQPSSQNSQKNNSPDTENPATSAKAADTSAIDNARNMNKKPDVVGDAAKSAAGDTAKNAAGDAAKNAVGDATKNAAGDVAKNAAGDAAKNAVGNAAGGVAGAALGAASTLKGAKDDPEAAAGQLAVEGVKGAAQLLDAVAPGAGTATSKVIGAIDSTVGQTEFGKKGKRCCGSCICTSCILAVFSAFLPILLLCMVFSSIFGANEIKEEEKDRNFIELIQESADLPRPQVHITDILDDALKSIKYPEYKAAIKAGELYKDTNGSIYILSVMSNNYSVARLKSPATTARTEDFPIDEDVTNSQRLPYYGMERRHIPMFEDLLNNPDKLKQMFNNDSEVVKFIDDIIKTLDKEYRIFNTISGIYENDISLRDLLEEISIYSGDAEYDINRVTSILNNHEENQKIIEQFAKLQEQLAKLEILTYMQAYRQYYIQINDMRKKALDGDYVLPDVYHTDEFFEQFSTITDLATYVALATSTPNSSLVYEIACDSISIWKDPPELASKQFDGKTISYIPILETWYANYTFDLITTGSTAILKCTGVESRQLDEQDWEASSNLLKRYNIDDKEKFFALFKRATGIDPVEGEENIYSPSGLDDTWQTEATFNIGSTKAYSSGIYSYTSNGESYSGSFGGYKSTDKYLNSSGASFPVAASNVRITMNFMERYPQYVIDKYGTSEYHRGIDYAVPIGTPVLAIREGVVLDATHSSGYGYYVKILHPDGSTSTYGHGNGVFNVKKDDIVTAGTQIMESGNSGNSTGPHMHLEVSGPDGKLVDPNLYMSSRP